MAFPRPPALLILLFSLPFAPGLGAQDLDTLAPPHVSLVDGRASLEREGRSEPAEAGHILAVGDRLRTETGRLEVLFGDGSVLHLDRRSTLDLLDEGLLRLIEGRVLLQVAAAPDGYAPLEFRIDTPAASIQTAAAGEYRVTTLGPGAETTELAIARGLADIVSPHGSIALRAGQQVRVHTGQAPGFALMYNAAAWDEFDRWSHARRAELTDPQTAHHLPSELTPYSATLARHGTWLHHPSHGVVWYPRVVAGWRPFYHGRWTVLDPFGWTWIGVDPWAWPTHYYGHWGVTTAGVWFWVPGRHWSSARVQWAIGVGHVGWVPFGVSTLHPFAWTVVPRNVFHVNVIVPRHAVRVQALPPRTRQAFVLDRPPVPRGVAVPRASVAARRGPVRTEAPDRFAVPRDAFRTRAASPWSGARPVRPGTGSRAADAPERARRLAEPATRPGAGVNRAVPRNPDTAGPADRRPSREGETGPIRRVPRRAAPANEPAPATDAAGTGARPGAPRLRSHDGAAAPAADRPAVRERPATSRAPASRPAVRRPPAEGTSAPAVAPPAAPSTAPARRAAPRPRTEGVSSASTPRQRPEAAATPGRTAPRAAGARGSGPPARAERPSRGTSREETGASRQAAPRRSDGASSRAPRQRPD